MLLVLLGISALPSTAYADPPARSDDPNEVVCRRQEPGVGTMMPRRVCKTRAQWAAEAASTTGRDDVRRPPVMGTPRNGG